MAVGKVLLIEEVSEWTRVPVSSLRHMRSQGTGPRSARAGKRLIYREEDVQAWLDARFTDDGPIVRAAAG